MKFKKVFSRYSHKVSDFIAIVSVAIIAVVASGAFFANVSLSQAQQAGAVFSVGSASGSNTFSSFDFDPNGAQALGERASNDSGGFVIAAQKSRGNLKSATSIRSGDNILNLVGYGYDGSDSNVVSQITLGTEGNISHLKVPGNISFWTSDSAGTLTKHMVIDPSGNVSIDNKLKVGSPTNPTGITLYDQNTKAPFCVVIKSGALTALAGACK